MLVALALGALAGAAADVRAADRMAELAGEYRLNERDVASGFLLEPDGRYEFFLMVGSVDEIDRGRWRIDKDHVVLTTDVPSDPPSLVFVRSSRVAEPGMHLVFEGDKGRLMAQIADARILKDSMQRGFNHRDGSTLHRVDVQPPFDRLVIYLLGGFRKYPVVEHRPTDPGHNHFVFRAHVGDYAHVRFDKTRLSIGRGDDGLELTMQVRGQEHPTVYYRVRAEAEPPAK